MTFKSLRETVRAFCPWVGVPFILWGCFIALSQAVYWLQAAIWVPVSVLDLFIEATYGHRARGGLTIPHDLVPKFFWGSWLWLENPSDLIGAHRIIYGLLEFIPLSIFLIVMGVVISLKLLEFADFGEHQKKAKPPDETV